MNKISDQFDKDSPTVSPEALAHLGDGQIAYVRPIMSDVLKDLFPDAPEMAPGIQLFVLNGADGTPLMLADSEETARASAREHELMAVSVH